MANKTNEIQSDAITLAQLRKSVVKVIEHLDHECYFFPDGGIPEDHVANHIETLVAWCNQEEQAAESEKYDGWKNFETWLVSAYLAVDVSLGKELREAASNFVQQEQKGEIKSAAFHLGLELMINFEEKRLPFPSLYDELMVSALAHVDWLELAKRYLDQD